MKFFVLGIGIGSVAGLLMAPQEGSRTRGELGRRIRDWFQDPRDSEDFGQDKSQQAGSDRARVVSESESEAVAEVLNVAKRDELMSVPGIGRATAKRIIKNRPYETEEEVLEEGVLPEKTLERVKEQLVENQLAENKEKRAS